MNKLILDKYQIQDLIINNKFKIDDKRQFLSRCIDGRYPNDIEMLALAVPGGDGGELALILAASNSYGFEVDFEKAYLSLLDVIGGVKNFNFHTDDHHQEGIASGCGHLAQMRIDPSAYQLEERHIDLIFEALAKAKKQGANETILHGPHLEGAVLMIKGDYGVNSQHYFQLGNKRELVQVFVFHETLVNSRHKLWAKKMSEENGIKLYVEDHEYLYEVLSDVTSDHLFETAKRLAKGLPIYSVNFEKDGSFKIGEMGMV